MSGPQLTEASYSWGSFKGHYIPWRKTRIKKLVKILGRDWFKGKSVLELGCGLGHIGQQLIIQYGAVVTFAEGREEYYNQIKERVTGADIILLNNETNWNLNKKFDLIIHWGLSYHLINWKQDLKCTLQHSDLVCFETEVMDSDKEEELKPEEKWFHGAISGQGTRASVVSIENCFKANGFNFQRYDDKDLNCEYFRYDWKAGGPDTKGVSTPGLRRFWMLRRQ